MQRIEEYNQLLEDSKEVLRKDTTLWKGFLKFATQFTHYQFFDQILIYVQNPKATACATFRISGRRLDDMSEKENIV